ncbi:MAG: diaminopimelate epimerase [Bacteroidota bacterium]
MKLHFYKYQGTGNDFILIDDRDASFPIDDNLLIAKLCDRRFGIGADGLILLQKDHSSAFFMRYYNSDGNQSSMCGNGGRCIAAFAHHLRVIGNETIFKAVDGLHEAIISEEKNEIFVKLKMQDVKEIKNLSTDLKSSDGFTFVLNTGSPHYISFVTPSIDSMNVVEEAKKIRYNNEFKTEGINVNFVNLAGLKKIDMRTYERGVEDETLSCGTGVTAAALSAAILNDLPNGIHTIDVKTKGGNLSVKFNFNKMSKTFIDVWLQGPATLVFEGDVKI